MMGVCAGKERGNQRQGQWILPLVALAAVMGLHVLIMSSSETWRRTPSHSELNSSAVAESSTETRQTDAMQSSKEVGSAEEDATTANSIDTGDKSSEGSESVQERGRFDLGYRPASNRTCDDEKYAVSSNGEPCTNLRRELKGSLIHYADGPDVQYLVCPIPKIGSTVHLSLVHRIYGTEDYHVTGVIHNATRKREIRLSSFENEVIGRMLANESLPKYLVVRNPMQRMLSAYLSKVEDRLTIANPDAPLAGVNGFQEWAYKEFPKGDNQTGKWRGVNPHWTPQLEFCGFRVREIGRYFNIFHFERPAGFVDFLYKIVPLRYLQDGWRKRDNLSFREHVLSPFSKTDHTNDKFFRYYNTLEFFDHMAYYLAEEIEAFGYKNDIRDMRKELVERLSG